MHGIEYRIASEKDIDLMMSSRLEMLRVVNGLDADYQFSEDFIHDSRVFFQKGNQTTVLAIAEENVIGCATICYIWLMPTFSHPTGKRAHLMNVYTSEPYRKQGVAKKMVSMLMEDAWNHGATEISLDSTPSGHPFYESLGFVDSKECMVFIRS